MQRKRHSPVNPNGAWAAVVSMALLSGALRHAAAEPPHRFEDGSAAAPAGDPLLPGILLHYAARPPWKVAGVDYAVGVPAGTHLLDPATIAIEGVAVDATNHTIVVSGNNVTISGYEFGRSGGWGIHVDAKAANTVVKNCNFLVGDNHLVPINAGAGSGNLTILDNTFNAANNSGAVWALVNYNGSGRFVAEYNTFENSPDDAIDFGAGTMTTVVEYNVFENLGTDPQAHADAVQYVGVTSNNSVISFNTVYQANPSGNQGLQIEAQNGSTITNTLVENNVIVAKGGARTMSFSIFVGAASGPNTIDGAVVANNYIDFSGAYGPFYKPTGSHLTYTGNVDMIGGRLLPGP
ncbi:MAG TPA: right-handed parallel beta-helix repeat-containing protein [Acetobacteraceae bacterium]|nr:right-handed parallel beta-helix repeat-containing protein [Acetobacteraceae bacterium]